MNSPATPAGVSKESDLMLWIGAGAVVGIGLIWLIVTQFSGPESVAPTAPVTPPPAGTPVADAAETPAAASDGQTEPALELENPLRLAAMAYEAGMLVEPEDLSAWTLYSRALKLNPDSDEARDGLERVAADLLRLGTGAIEQGRYDDAQATVARILGPLPDHEGALALRSDIEAQRAAELARAEQARRQAEARAAERARAEAGSAPDDGSGESARTAAAASDATLSTLREGFDSAMAANQLLVPADGSAKHYVEELLAADAADERSTEARDLLVTEMLSRSNQSIEALDWDSARTWIDEAEALAGDTPEVQVQRQRLADALVAVESEKPLPASDLEVLSYAAPEYPRTALSRGIEGWVDLEFTVTSSGGTRDIRVTESSHDRYFRDEAVRAVEAWTFEPRTFMGRTISQRAYTRLRFVLTED